MKKESDAQNLRKFMDFSDLSNRILTSANRGASREEFLKEILGMLLNFSHSSQAELFIGSPDLCIHCREDSAQAFQYRFFHRNDQSPACDRLCGICLDKIFNHKEHLPPFSIVNGILSTTGEKIILAGNFSYILLLPFRLAEENNGVLVLMRNTGFSSDDIVFYQALVQTIGIAITNRRTQADLKERIKEIGCMFSICQLHNLPDLPLSSILRRIAALLPPAMQYPEKASGLIDLDGAIYKSPGCKSNGRKITSDILIDGAKRGQVQVIYKEEKTGDPFIFLSEESNLLDSVARNIALIVQKKQAQEEKNRLQDQLRHADRLATIGQLAAGVAHELNEPLANILGFTQLAQKEKGIPEQVKKDLEKVVKASLHARDIVRKLLIFSRQMPTRLKKIRLNPLIEDVISFFEIRFIKDHIKPLLLLDSELPAITADLSQMRQVLVNLIVNGMQAMEDGGVLEITTLSNKNDIVVKISDTGHGMEKDVLDRIFIPFFSTKKVGQGTGLGLPVVHGIISSHGGSISAESLPGKGTTFTVTLPLNRPHEKKGEIYDRQ